MQPSLEHTCSRVCSPLCLTVLILPADGCQAPVILANTYRMSGPGPWTRRSHSVRAAGNCSAGLLATLAGSTFGQVIDALQKALEERVDQHLCELPQVVFIGSEDAGKSSLLENLTKQRLFPAGNGLQTRCPVVVDLHPCHGEGSPVYSVHRAGHGARTSHTSMEQALQAIQTRMPPAGTIESTPLEVTITAVSANAKKQAPLQNCMLGRPGEHRLLMKICAWVRTSV